MDPDDEEESVPPYDEDDPEDDPLADAMEECGQLADGTCMRAGTKYCDFDCPFRK